MGWLKSLTGRSWVEFINANAHDENFRVEILTDGDAKLLGVMKEAVRKGSSSQFKINNLTQGCQISTQF